MSQVSVAAAAGAAVRGVETSKDEKDDEGEEEDEENNSDYEDEEEDEEDNSDDDDEEDEETNSDNGDEEEDEKTNSDDEELDEKDTNREKFFDELNALHLSTSLGAGDTNEALVVAPFDAKKLFGEAFQGGTCRRFRDDFSLSFDELSKYDTGNRGSKENTRDLDLFFQCLSKTKLVGRLSLEAESNKPGKPVAPCRKLLFAIAENPCITYLSTASLWFTPPCDALCQFFTKTISLTELYIGLTHFGRDIDEAAVASAALGANRTLQRLKLSGVEDGDLLECLLSALGAHTGLTDLTLECDYKLFHMRGLTGFLAATKSLTRLNFYYCRFHLPPDNMQCLVDGLVPNKSLQKLIFESCVMGREAVRDLADYMQSPVLVDTDGTTTFSIRELYFRMRTNPFRRAQESMSSVAKAIFTIPRGQETTIAHHNLRVFDCQRQNDFGDFPFKNFNGLFYLLGTNASTMQLRRFRATIVSSRALRGLCGLIPKLVRLEELAVHFCNDEDETIRESELRDGVLQETVRRKLVKALRRNGSIHTVQLERRDMGSEGPSSDLGRLGNAYLERNRRIPQMLAAPPRFSDAAEASVAAPSSEHATIASIFPALFQCSSKAPNMTPKNVLSGLRSFGEGTGPDGPGKRALAL